MRKTKLLIAGLLICCILPAYGYHRKDNKSTRLNGRWHTHSIKRSLSKIPISGEVTNGLLILTNSQPDRTVYLEIRNSQGVSILTKEILQENSAYMVIPLDALQDGEEYTLIITSSIKSDQLITILFPAKRNRKCLPQPPKKKGGECEDRKKRNQKQTTIHFNSEE